MAVGDAYGAKEWREGEGDDEVAFRTERIERRICRAVAEFAFREAERAGAKVFGGPKYTVSPTYEGMLKEEMDAAAARHPDVRYEPQLIDATFALLVASAGDPLVIPALNRDGDILSDLVLPLFGSIAGAESLLVAFDDDFEPDAVMAEAAHGTAPSLQGKNVANPMAMILAGAALLALRRTSTAEAGRAIREACLEAVAEGVRTADLGGHAGTTEFTDEVIRRVRSKLEVWSTLLSRRRRRQPAAARSAAVTPKAPDSHASRNATATSGSNWRAGAAVDLLGRVLDRHAQRGTAGPRSSRRSCRRRARIAGLERDRRRRRARSGSRRRPSARGGRARAGSGGPQRPVERDHPRADLRVRAHLSELLGGQRAGLVQHRVARRRACRRRAARRRAGAATSRASSQPSRSPTSYAIRATRAEWPRVYGSQASTASERASSAAHGWTDFAPGRVSLLQGDARPAARMRACSSSIVDAISGSAWSYAIIFGVAALDAFFPLVPSETTVIAAGVLAASGDLQHRAGHPRRRASARSAATTSRYWIGRTLGERIAEQGRSPATAARHLDRAHQHASRSAAAT